MSNIIVLPYYNNDCPVGLFVILSSTIFPLFLQISIGYFLADLAMILWHFPALGGLEYVS